MVETTHLQKMLAARRMPKAKTSEARVCLGAFAGAHGVRGAVLIKAFTEVPADIAAYGPVHSEDGTQSFRLSVTGQKKGGVIAKVEGIETRDEAQALKGTRFYVGRDKLPEPDEEEFYYADLIGLHAEKEDGEPLGTVKAVQDFGGGDLLEIQPARGATVFVPFTSEAVPNVDIRQGKVTIADFDALIETPADRQNRDDRNAETPGHKVGDQ